MTIQKVVYGCLFTQEYLAICEEYGVVVTPENIKDVEAIADENGEVSFVCNSSVLILFPPQSKKVPKKAIFNYLYII